MNYVELINTFGAFSYTDWFNFIGSILAFILFTIKVVEYRQNQVKLDIFLKPVFFSTKPLNNENEIYDKFENFTYVEIQADIKNTGRQPTTISSIKLVSNDERFTNLEMYNVKKEALGSPLGWSIFNPIRVESNDRKEINIFAGKGGYLNDFESMNCTILFTTTHELVKKKITIVGNE